MLRSIVALLAGLLSGVIVILAFEFASNTLFPPPAGFLQFSPAQFAHYVQQLPAMAFVLVLLGWFFGAADAAILSAWLAPQRPLWHAAIVCTIFLLMAAINLFTVPHPFWMVLVTPFIYIAAFLIGSAIGKRLNARRQTSNSTASG